MHHGGGVGWGASYMRSKGDNIEASIIATVMLWVDDEHGSMVLVIIKAPSIGDSGYAREEGGCHERAAMSRMVEPHYHPLTSKHLCNEVVGPRNSVIPKPLKSQYLIT